MHDGIDMNTLLSSPQSSLQDLHTSHFDPISADHDFLDQMFSSIPPTSCSWPELNPSDLSPTNEVPGDSNGAATFNYFGESALLASKLRQHQTSARSSGPSSATKAMMLQQQMMMMARGFDRTHGDVQGGEDSMYNGFGGSLLGGAPHFPHPQGGSQSFAAEAQVAKLAPVASGSTAASVDGSTGKPKQRMRARRGQATDPHSIAERLRRERIAERMKALQELVPNANKTDKASMLDEIIDYVKFIQIQVKVLSMSRLGSARTAAVAPMVALAHQDGGGDCIKGSGGSSGESMAVTENQVAKLLEEDMGSAMQYLQGKGLCLMPISLATAISTATTCRNPTTIPGHGNGDGPTSPNMSALTVQSSAAAANGGGSDGSSSKDSEP